MKRLSLAVAAGPVVLSIAGCVATAPEWERNFGEAARQTRAAQVLDLDASARNTRLPPTDGKAVAGAQRAYADSYGYAVKEVTPQTLNISTTGNGGGR